MTTPTPKRIDEDTLSPECALAQSPGYADLHAACAQLDDVPLPHAKGLLLARRCRCPCHGRRRA
ncbi:hypothetical protein [Streptomyces fractus]|uniref:hypothetical protein n=1 Tax=Streptomyces fractus TaxID=641806 RepID=UPI003CEE4C74